MMTETELTIRGTGRLLSLPNHVLGIWWMMRSIPQDAWTEAEVNTQGREG